jgi:hypothetical protein
VSNGGRENSEAPVRQDKHLKPTISLLGTVFVLSSLPQDRLKMKQTFAAEASKQGKSCK